MMRHLMMGGMGHHGMAGGMGLWMMHRMMRKVMLFVVVGGLLAVVAVLLFKLRAARRTRDDGF